MTPQSQHSKIEQSPHFQRIVERYREHKGTLSKKEIFNTHIQPLDPLLHYHQFIRLTLKLDKPVAVEASKITAQYVVDGEISTAKMRQELYLKALQLGDQSLTSTLELWERQPEKITSKQLRDFFRMYKEMEQVRQADEIIDLKKKEQEYEQKFKPAGMFANMWIELFKHYWSGRVTKEESEIFEQAIDNAYALINAARQQEREKQLAAVGGDASRLQEMKFYKPFQNNRRDFQTQTQPEAAIPAPN